MKYLLFISFVFLATCVPQADQVHYAIPNYTEHNWYSGYLNFTGGDFHYVLFESQSDPDNDPLVLWLNGGPGCSSLLGMVYENGPFVFVENTTSFEINENAWNKKANLLYISSPGGVGFSISKRGIKHDDGTVAEDNYNSLLAFFKKFPKLKNNDLYLTGQSYAGIYIPYLAHKIITKNKLPETQLKMKLKGIMIGNACTDPRECWQPGNDINLGIYQYQNLYNHGYMTEHDHNQITGACMLGYKSDQCAEIRKIVDAKFYATKTSMLNLYAKCMNQPVPHAYQDKEYIRLAHGRKVKISEDNTICEDMKGSHHWFNEAIIQTQLHVTPMHFDECSDDVGTNYTMFQNASYWIYPLLLKESLRVWIFEGDVDNSVPITGTLTWIPRMRDEFGIPIEEQWREWWVPGLHKHEDQVAGMTWRLKGFTFASVKGAGHMVPKDKRKQAKVLLDHFLKGQGLPKKTE